jgi:PilZ domain
VLCRECDNGQEEANKMANTQRRSSPRYPADWSARYRGDPNAEWRACRIIDLSEHGAAVELRLAPGTSVEPRLQIEISSLVRDEAGVVLWGDIRHQTPTGSDRLLVGIEFAPIGNDQANLLRLLVALRSIANDA